MTPPGSGFTSVEVLAGRQQLCRRSSSRASSPACARTASSSAGAAPRAATSWPWPARPHQHRGGDPLGGRPAGGRARPATGGHDLRRGGRQPARPPGWRCGRRAPRPRGGVAGRPRPASCPRRCAPSPPTPTPGSPTDRARAAGLAPQRLHEPVSGGVRVDVAGRHRCRECCDPVVGRAAGTLTSRDRSSPSAIAATSPSARRVRRTVSSRCRRASPGATTAPSTSSATPSPADAVVRSTGGRHRPGWSGSPCPCGPRPSIARRSRAVAAAPSRSALLTTSRSPISRIPAFAAWMPSPCPARAARQIVSAARRPDLALPDPTVSTRTTSKPRAEQNATAWGAAADGPEVAAGRHRAYEDTGVEGVSDIRTRSPSSAPPLNGDDGSTASTATRWSAAPLHVWTARGRVRLADHGRAGQPDDVRVPGVGCEQRHDLASAGAPSSTSDRVAPVAESTLAGLVDEVRDRIVGPARGDHRDAHDQGVALAAAAAQRGRTDAAAAAAELVDEVSTTRPRLPTGCPSAIAPPLTLTMSSAMPSSRMDCDVRRARTPR